MKTKVLLIYFGLFAVVLFLALIITNDSNVLTFAVNEYDSEYNVSYNWQTSFDYNGKTEIIYLRYINEATEKAVFEIAKQNITIKEGASAQVDMNKDDVKDVIVYLNKINYEDRTIELNVQKLN